MSRFKQRITFGRFLRLVSYMEAQGALWGTDSKMFQRYKVLKEKTKTAIRKQFCFSKPTPAAQGFLLLKEYELLGEARKAYVELSSFLADCGIYESRHSTCGGYDPVEHFQNQLKKSEHQLDMFLPYPPVI